jgi:integrase
MSALPFSELRTRVVAYYEASRRKPMTRQRVEQLLTEIERVLPSEATSADLGESVIVRWLDQFCQRRKASTVIGYLSYLRALWTVLARIAPLDPLPDWKRLRPRHRQRVGPHLPWQEAARLLTGLRARAEAGDWRDWRIYICAAVALYCGLRRDELLCLRKDQIDFENEVIWIESHGDLSIEAKTEKSEAPVPIPPELLPDLRHYHGMTKGPYLFPGVKSRRPWRHGSNGRRPIDSLRAAAKKCGIEVRDWQMLRRTWATAAAGRWGRSDREIQQVLRHTSPIISKRHYCGTDLANLRQTASHVTYRINGHGGSAMKPSENSDERTTLVEALTEGGKAIEIAKRIIQQADISSLLHASATEGTFLGRPSRPRARPSGRDKQRRG